MKCKNCGEKPQSVPVVKSWTEIHVGEVPSREKFHLCPDCAEDSEVDPLDFVEYYELKT